MIKAMKQMLEALESYYGYMEPLTTVFGGPRVPAEQSTTGKVEKAITAGRQAIEQAEKQEQGEPVAWLYPEGLEALQRGKCWTAYGTKQDNDCNIPVYLNAAVAPKVEPAKAECGGFDSHPAAQRQWIGLTDEEIKEIVGPYGDAPIKGYTRKLFDQIEAALRSKNT